MARNLAVVRQLEKMAAAKSCTAAQLALAWVLSRGEDIVPIFGTKRRTYLEENLEALNVRLSAEDLRRIEDVAPKGVFVGERYAEAMMNLLKKSQ